MHAHTRRHRMVGITITVGFKSLRKLVDRLTRYLFTGVMCMLKWGQQGQEAFSSQYKITGRRQDPTALHSCTAAACQERDA